MNQEILFDPITIGKTKIKNWIAFAPTGMGAADLFRCPVQPVAVKPILSRFPFK